jgi:lysophospholipase L1-like esterase
MTRVAQCLCDHYPVLMFQRYVAIGDSTSEGLDDPDGHGGYRGWADRFAALTAAAQDTPLEYANLAIRGRETHQIRDEQLPAALALHPDLATVVSGMNDVLRRTFDAAAIGSQLHSMQAALVAQGATVLTFTMPDPGPVMPMARPLRHRFITLNEAIRDACARSGALLLDLGAHAVASDPRLWSDDRLHANSAGHTRIAAALAATLGLPGADDTWTLPLPPAPRRGAAAAVAAEARWVRRHLLPWIGRHLRGHSSGDGITAKRPIPVPVDR